MIGYGFRRLGDNIGHLDINAWRWCLVAADGSIIRKFNVPQVFRDYDKAKFAQDRHNADVLDMVIREDMAYLRFVYPDV